MKEVHVSTRSEWRRWLTANHDKETSGIWLAFCKKQTDTPSLQYEEAVEEALCFGWIDSIIKRIDDVKYCRKFTPRKPDSIWSQSNKQRVEKMLKAGRMTEFGLAKIDAAKASGNWERDARPLIDLNIPQDLSRAFAQNQKAKAFFKTLAPSYQKQFIGWLVTAKRSDTRAKRLKESLTLLARGTKLGLK